MNIDLDGHLQAPAETLIGKHIAVVGKTGSGKTTTAMALAAPLLESGQPMTFIDPLGQFAGLKTRYPIISAGARGCDVTLAPENAATLARFSFEQRVSIILETKFYGKAAQMQLLKAYLDALWELIYQQDHPLPYGLVIDEAHLFVPQGKDTPLSETIIDIAKMGRHMRMTTIVTTQRPASIDKNFLTQAHLLIGHKMMLPVDMGIFHDLLDMPRKQVNATLKGLKAGQAVVVGDEVFLGDAEHLLVQVRRVDIEEQPEDGATITPAKLQRIDAAMLEQLRQLLETEAEPAPASVDVAALRARIAELEVRLAECEERRADEEAKIVEAYEARLVETAEKHERELAEKEAEITRLTKQLRMMELRPQAMGEPVAVPLMQVDAIEARSLRVAERTTTTVTERYAEGTHVSSRQLTLRMKRQESAFARLLDQVKRLPPASRRILAVSLEEDSAMTAEAFARLLDYAVKTVSDRLYTLQALGLVSRVDKHHWQGAGWQTLAEDYPDLDTGTLFVELMEAVEE